MPDIPEQPPEEQPLDQMESQERPAMDEPPPQQPLEKPALEALKHPYVPQSRAGRLAISPTLVVASALGIVLVAVVTGAFFLAIQDSLPTTDPSKSTPTAQQMSQLLQEVTYKTPMPTPASTPDPRTPVVGSLATPSSGTPATGGGTSTDATPAASAGTPAASAAPAGGGATPVPTIDLGLNGPSTSATRTTSPGTTSLGTPQPTVAPFATTPVGAATPTSASTPSLGGSSGGTGSSSSPLFAITPASLTTNSPLFGSTPTP